MAAAKCRSCGKSYTDHVGIEGACAALQKALAEVARLHALLRAAQSGHHAAD